LLLLQVRLRWPLVVRAQQPARIPIVSVLWHGTKERELANPFYHWVVQGFENAGLKSGVNVIIDHEFADGRAPLAAMRKAIAEFLREMNIVERSVPDPWLAARTRLRADPNAALAEFDELLG
jgi:hypothetical protein